jgi:hypothetical protein
VLAELQAKGVRADIIEKIVDTFEALAARRERDRQRLKRYRNVTRPKISKNNKPVTLHETLQLCDAPKPARTKRALTTMPADWHPIIAEKDRGEFVRFTDYCTAHAKRYANWDAAWRNWLSSPYRNRGNGHGRRSGSLLDVTDKLDDFFTQNGVREYVPGTSGPRPVGVGNEGGKAHLQRLPKG